MYPAPYHGSVLISRKKQPYPISDRLRRYLERHDREVELPVRYEDLTFYGDTIPVYDKLGRDTLWESVLYPSHERKRIQQALVDTYATLRVTGEGSHNDAIESSINRG